MAFSTQILPQLQSKQHVKRWVVGFSGGLDSSVLAYMVHQWVASGALAQPLHLIHINHQLSPLATDWQRHCEQYAKVWGVTIEVVRVSVSADKHGIEAAARVQRYQAFEQLLSAGDCLLLGHHQNDQAETLLLRLLRGAGVLGLGAIPADRQVGRHPLLRPLLTISREQLHRYAAKHQLSWVDDDSNQSLAFDRNYLRHQVLPPLVERWPSTIKQLQKTAGIMQETQLLLTDLATLDLLQADEQNERWGVSIDCRVLSVLSRPRQDNLLRYWLAQHQFALPEQAQLQQLHQQLLMGEPTHTQAVICWSGVELRRFNDRLYLSSVLPAFADPGVCTWDIRRPITVAGNHLSVTPETQGGLHLPDGSCEVRWRRGGERCCPEGRAHSQVLKKLLQEYQLETWLRDRVPCIYVDNHLAAVGDLWVCRDFVAPKGLPGYRLHWDICP